MSHFTVLVIGENPENQLAPFQENNMGDCPKEYLKYRYDGEYYDNEDAARLVIGEEFDPEENGYWENPNKKWDWYQLGGRWTGFFKMKDSMKGEIGKPGLMTPGAKSGYADQARKNDIDFVAMRNDAGERAGKNWDIAYSVIGDLPECRALSDIGSEMGYSDEARALYGNQPRVLAWRKAGSEQRETWPFGWTSGPEDVQVSRENYMENARNGAIATFAVIKDGQWYESGKMGWWGITSDEKDKNVWANEFGKLLDSVPDGTLLSVYDCHI